MSGRTGWIVAGIWAVVAVAGLGLALVRDGGARLAPVEPRWLEIPAPDVEFQTLEGGTASLTDYTGEVVVLNLWGTWCPPCRREIPELVVLQDALAGRGTVIGIAVESGKREEIRAYASEFGVDYPIWISSAQKGLAHFGAMGYPFTILIDESGVIRRQYLGPQSTESLAADITDLTGRPLTLPETG